MWRLLFGGKRGVLEYVVSGEALTAVGGGGVAADHAVELLALSPDGRLMAASYGEHGLEIYRRARNRWRQHAQPLSFTGAITHLAFARNDRLLVTSARQVRVLDDGLRVVGVLLNLDEQDLVAARALPDGEKLVTIAANNVLREWWLDDARVLREAKRRR